MHNYNVIDPSSWVRLSNGTYTLPHQAAEMQAEIDEDNRYQKKMAKHAPYKIGDIVYLKSISGRKELPVEFINKPLKVIGLWHPEGLPSDFWDVDLEGCDYMVNNEDLTTTKPF